MSLLTFPWANLYQSRASPCAQGAREDQAAQGDYGKFLKALGFHEVWDVSSSVRSSVGGDNLKGGGNIT